MALTAYCKRCGREVDAAEICPFCGTKLGKNAAHAAWCMERTPARDWMCWNSVMRLLLPVALGILILVFVLEGISGGAAAVEKLIASGFPAVLGILLAGILIGVLADLLLQGKELSDFVVDNRGIHETRYLPNPTALKLMARLKSPGLMNSEAMNENGTVLKLKERHLPWKEVARVQQWPEKCMILFYAPAWWLRIPVICTPFSWEDVNGLIREKLGKKKKVVLPPSLVVQSAAGAGRRRSAATPARAAEEYAEQMRMEEWSGTEADLPDPEPVSEGERAENS